MVKNTNMTEPLYLNAFTNNTFDLSEVENTIRRTIDNSFWYLKDLQKSYISLHRFNFSEEDLYVNEDGRVCLTLDKDFIENSKRKAYKYSKFYNKLATIDDICENRDVFTFFPLLLIDKKTVFNFKVKSSLDGTTLIVFDYMDMMKTFMETPHIIEVVLLKNGTYQKFTTNKYALANHEWSLPVSVTKLKIDHSQISFMVLKDSRSYIGSNIIFPEITEENDIILTSQKYAKFFEDFKSVDIYIITTENLVEIPYCKQIQTRIDNRKKSALVVVDPDGDHNMPIPTNNLFIFKHNKETDEYTYENNLKVVLHYPNIYEIMSSEDPELYDYKVYYFYRQVQDYLRYDNHLNRIHRFFSKKLEMPIEDALSTLAYEGVDDENIQKYFWKIFGYTDETYVYDHKDFFKTYKPYDIQYKIEKMREFISKNPKVLQKYAEDVSVPFDNYFMNVKDINLETRLRKNTFQEAKVAADKFIFREDRYVFIFRNEAANELDLRVFIDGLLCTDLFQLHIGPVDYIYIPTAEINENSYIEIERFHSYVYATPKTFTSEDDCVILNFPRGCRITPTVADLFATNTKFERLNMSDFSIQILIDKSIYDKKADLTGNKRRFLLSFKSITEDETTGELFADVTNTDEVSFLFIQNALSAFENSHEGIISSKEEIHNFIRSYAENEDIELDITDGEFVLTELDNQNNPILTETGIFEPGAMLQFFIPKRLKVFCLNPELHGSTVIFMINKLPYLSHTKMSTLGLPKMQLFNGRVPWREIPSYVRTFINGRLIPISFEIVRESPTLFYFVPHCLIEKGDVVSIDITPFSYTLEYQNDLIPEDFLISFQGHLSLPFSFKYYDMYLNGRKLNSTNVRIISPDKIILVNVHSRKNLYIFKKDRDREYFGYNPRTLKKTYVTVYKTYYDSDGNHYDMDGNPIAGKITPEDVRDLVDIGHLIPDKKEEKFPVYVDPDDGSYYTDDGSHYSHDDEKIDGDISAEDVKQKLMDGELIEIEKTVIIDIFIHEPPCYYDPDGTHHDEDGIPLPGKITPEDVEELYEDGFFDLIIGAIPGVQIPVDDILDSNDITDEDKEIIIDDIIYGDEDPDDPENPSDVNKGEDTETEVVPNPDAIDNFFQQYTFYLDIVVPAGKITSNLMVNAKLTQDKYTHVFDTYTNGKSRVVLSPNKNYDASIVLWVGKEPGINEDIEYPIPVPPDDYEDDGITPITKEQN